MILFRTINDSRLTPLAQEGNIKGLKGEFGSLGNPLRNPRSCSALVGSSLFAALALYPPPPTKHPEYTAGQNPLYSWSYFDSTQAITYN